jgi:hypothetical protein
MYAAPRETIPDSRTSIVVIMILMTVALAFLAAVNARRSQELFKRCGLFYQQMVLPPDSRFLRWTSKGSVVAGVLMQIAVWYVLIATVHHMLLEPRWTASFEVLLPGELKLPHK